MNTLKKRQEHGQLQQQKASEIWDKQTDSDQIQIGLWIVDRQYETENLNSKTD